MEYKREENNFKSLIREPFNNRNGSLIVIVFFYLAFLPKYDILFLVTAPRLVQEGGVSMEVLVTFFAAVTANVIAYYICKWLDGGR